MNKLAIPVSMICLKDAVISELNNNPNAIWCDQHRGITNNCTNISGDDGDPEWHCDKCSEWGFDGDDVLDHFDENMRFIYG